jgi:3-hydroxyacyl-CoA dehydrogenase/enoyl-CoA hydratase/3-hydroxybutyryl-CoA epimerase
MNTKNSAPAFRLEIDDERVATLTFDQPGTTANVFNESTLMELDERLAEVESAGDLAGLIICSAKPTIFIAGADLNELSEASGPTLSDLITLGQNVFERLASLAIATVAAINGACAGGGCELALACDWRIASDSPKTRIGLPETKLGIIPAWGGCTRLPALVGLPKALNLILSGRLLKPIAARKSGLIDEVVPPEYLLAHARASLGKGKRRSKRRYLLHNPLSTALIKRKVRAAIRARTRGHYPAPFKALEVASRSLSTTALLSRRNEREAILDLAERPETKNLTRLFFLSDYARKLRIPDAKPATVHSGAVVGAGVMGAGIAYWLSARGLRLILQDLNVEALAQGMNRIESHYAKAVKQGVMSKVDAARGLDRVVPIADPVPLRGMDIVIEAATEDLEIKRKIFRDLALRAGPRTILATNTSALPLGELASCVSLPERLIGLHFFNPVHRMKLVEVVRTGLTSPDTLATAVQFVQRLGKFPVVVADHPGFLVNRILLPYLLQAVTLFEHGGDPVAIDRSMLDFGMPMGPLRLLDEVGLDVAMNVAQTLSRAFPDRMSLPLLMEQVAREGHLGVKTGSGFYVYDERGPRPNPVALALRGPTEVLPDDLGLQLARTMVSESRRCLEDGVTESPDDIDRKSVV